MKIRFFKTKYLLRLLLVLTAVNFGFKANDFFKSHRKANVLIQKGIELKKQRQLLEKDLQRLRIETLDADYLDEQLRKNFGLARPDERVIMY